MDLFRGKKEPEKPLIDVAPPRPTGDAPPAEPAVDAAPAEAPASAAPAAPPVEAASERGAAGVQGVQEKVLEVLRNTYDPEIPVNIYELGLVYEARVEDSGEVYIRMTLTSPACPVAGSLPPEVESRVRAIPGVTDVRLDLVWDPPWNPGMMSEAARLQLGMM
jgi:FeS assembly SUF system protein